jgi:hypothetical protein
MASTIRNDGVMNARAVASAPSAPRCRKPTRYLGLPRAQALFSPVRCRRGGPVGSFICAALPGRAACNRHWRLAHRIQVHPTQESGPATF